MCALTASRRAAIALCLTALFAAAAHAQTKLNGKIAFTRDPLNSFDSQIYIMNPDGTGQTPLTAEASAAFDPAWSPDGAKIAYVHGSFFNQLVVINADGSSRMPIFEAFFIRGPACSPDGTRIAYDR